MPDGIGEAFPDAESFNECLKKTLPEDQLQHVLQVEKILALAGVAQRKREIEHYQVIESDLEDIDQGAGELHGFLTSACMLMEAQEGRDSEPFRDEFIIRQFTRLPSNVQRQLVTEFWSEDPEIAAMLAQMLELNQTEIAALILWLDREERRTEAP